MKSQFNKTIYLSLAVMFALSVFGAVWQGQYSIDHAHWGSMISNAKDMAEGLAPYKNIYILYGFLTTSIHAFAYKYLGANLQSLILVTSVFYACGLLLVYFIAERVESNQKIALAIVLTYFLVHPFAIYPWSNYLAFPLLMLGLFNSLSKEQKSIRYFISGFAFALAVLTREGLLPPVLLYLVAVIIIDVLNESESKIKKIREGLVSLAGFVLPILIFIAYLYSHDILNYWKTMSWNLPQLYAAEFFPHMKGMGLIVPFIKQIVSGVLRLDVRWMLILMTVLINGGVVVLGVLSSQYRQSYSNNFKVALLSMLLISSALHLPEIFRLATGGMIGLVNVYMVGRKIKAQFALFAVLAITLSITIAPTGSGDSFSTTNYFWPNENKIKNTKTVFTPSYFRNQKWEADAIGFYNEIEADLKKVHAVCKLKYHYNMTQDSFLVVISPFERYQIAAHWTSDAISNLRPDLNIEQKLKKDRDILILQELANDGSDIAKIPEDFVLFKKYKTPKTTFLYRDASLSIYIPKLCEEALATK
ncbi:hypothetical protein G3I67_09525 [Orrella sp. NBD-18]|uniref:Glycosyltransferase RgtA/B/C/D-like domain-containing protein n=1 Tax=Sheuella amnicola TaxID=2707330 RepID=A0A6B2QYD2_9BURK|nr:hypothetical protein [Sheuella amnicola]NDY83470.1 hypothetical protein [Sheuella amnicola]